MPALPGIAFGDPFSATNPFFGAGLDQQKRQEASRKSPAAKAERLASRTRSVGLSAGQSRALGRRTFPETFASDLFDGALPGPGLKIVQYRGGGVAVAETSTGERLLVRSSAPLRAQAPNGALEPVDLSLRESADTFSTTNSNADLRISKNPADGTELLGRDIAIALDTDKRSTGTAADGRVFYADVDTDTDYVVAPLPDGGEFSWLLRSPKAPERFVLDFKIPQGAKVRRAQSKNPIPGDPPENLEIVDGDKVLGYIEAPRTYDADNTPVKSQLVILGDDRVAMTVEHQGRDLRYPLLADPEVVVPNDYSRGWLGWRNWYSHGANWNANTNYYGFALFDPAYNANGVYLSMPTNTYFWPQGTGVNFSYTAPADTYVYRTIMGSIGHNPMPFWYSYGYLFSHIYSGILNSANNNWEAGQSWQSNYGSGAQGIFGPYGYAIGNLQLDHCFETRCNRAAGSEQNQADFGLAAINNYNGNNIFTGNEKATATMGYASVFLGDRYNPWMRSDAQPPNRDWTDDSANPTHTLPGVTAEDKGLGIYGITLAGAASGNGTLRPSCDGDPNRNYCPKAWTAYGFSYQLNEGITGLSLTPQDIVDNAGAAQTWTEKVDRGAPGLDVTGTLKDAADDIAPNTATVRVAATDGTDAAPRSGVRSIEILVDGTRAFYETQACDQSCPMTRDWTYQAADYGLGKHTIKVIARDGVDLAATDTWEVYSDDLGPEIATGGTLLDVAEQTIAEATYDVSVEAGDGAGASGGTGVTRLEILVDGQRQLVRTQTCPDGGCSLAAEWDFDTAQFGDGEHTITVVARDSAGNENSEEWAVTVRLPADLAHHDLSIAQGAQRTLTGSTTQRAGQSVANVGDANGDGVDDYAVGAPGASPSVLKLGAGSVYVISGAATGSQALEQAALYRIDGALPADAAGSSVSSAGDLNGDGLADLLVGAPGTGLTAGKVYAVFGRLGSATVDLANLGDRGFTITGSAAPTALLQPGARLFGTSIGGQSAAELAPAGDVNGDGLADIVVGSPLETANGQTGAGAAYVIFGKANNAPVATAALGSAGFAITGAAANHATGYAVAMVGDVNQDDLSDIAITAPGAHASGRTDAGSAYVVYGKTDAATVNVGALGAEQGLTIRGSTGDALGNSIAGLGDTDGDNIEDLAIGGSKTYVVRNQDAPTDIDLSSTDLAYQAVPSAADAAAKAVVAPGGDLNADGMADMVAGYPNANGAVYALLSQEGRDVRTQPVLMNTMPGEQGSRIAGSANEQLGRDLAVLSTSDTTDPAIVIGAPAAGGPTTTGATYMVRSTTLRGGTPQPITAGAAQAGTPPAVRNGCYTGRTIAYLWTDPVALNQWPSKCRRTLANNREETKLSPKNGFRNGSRGYGNRQPIGGNIRRPLRPGKRLNNRQRTPLYDSRGDLMGYLQQLSNGFQFRLFDASETLISANPRDQRLKLEFEGTSLHGQQPRAHQARRLRADVRQGQRRRQPHLWPTNSRPSQRPARRPRRPRLHCQQGLPQRTQRPSPRLWLGALHAPRWLQEPPNLSRQLVRQTGLHASRHLPERAGLDELQEQPNARRARVRPRLRHVVHQLRVSRG